jgi:two-component system phosphate regulon sensor histidine kinase PhoR
MKHALQELLTSLPKPVVKHIQHLERMRQDFVANVSHELRTPLTVIHGYLEALLDQDLDETKQWKKIFLQMHQQTLRMENLVENLLLLSRLESNENVSRAEQEVSVAKLLTEICAEAKELSGDAHHVVRLQMDKDLKLSGWEEELYSLFSNIIFNAVKYTAAKGRIEISWYQKNNHAYFRVQDTGIGIAEEHIPRLTERFYRVDPARSRASGGTGLGLALAKHVLLRHQATLEIQSELGKGSVFTCVFPKKRIVI